MDADEESAESPWERVGPATAGGRLLRRAWQPISRSGDLVANAAPLRVRWLDEHFTLYRGRSGRPVLLQDRCPHRGTWLSLGTLEGDDLRCHHHGWRFDAEGHCVERRGDPTPPHVRCNARAHPVVEYLGLVFAWLADGEPSPLPRFPAYEAPGTLRILPPDVWPCSFFQRLENSCDVAHLTTAHTRSGLAASLTGELGIAITESEEGIEVRASVGAAPLPPIRFRMPNLLEFATPVSERVGWRDHLVWRVPIDDVSCASFVVTLVPASVPDAASYRFDEPIVGPLGPSETARIGDEVLSGRRTLDDVASASLTEIEDYVALVSQGLPREGVREALGRLDAPVVALRRCWRRAASSGRLTA